MLFCLLCRSSHIMAGDADITAAGGEHSADNLHGGCFSCPVRTEETKDIATMDRKAYIAGGKVRTIIASDLFYLD